MPARTGNQCIDGPRATDSEIWLGSEKVVADQPMLIGAADAGHHRTCQRG